MQQPGLQSVHSWGCWPHLVIIDAWRRVSHRAWAGSHWMQGRAAMQCPRVPPPVDSGSLALCPEPNRPWRARTRAHVATLLQGAVQWLYMLLATPRLPGHGWRSAAHSSNFCTLPSAEHSGAAARLAPRCAPRAANTIKHQAPGPCATPVDKPGWPLRHVMRQAWLAPVPCHKTGLGAGLLPACGNPVPRNIASTTRCHQHRQYYSTATHLSHSLLDRGAAQCRAQRPACHAWPCSGAAHQPGLHSWLPWSGPPAASRSLGDPRPRVRGARSRAVGGGLLWRARC